MENFWQQLKVHLSRAGRGIFVLAPMADVTDAAFRAIIAKYGKPDVMFTEFVSADGLALAPEEGRAKLLMDLKYSEAERPIVAQFFTSSPEHMRKAAELARELKFDGIDINMGCPVKKIINQQSCSALIKTPELAREIIYAAKEGSGNLPVSIKTRIGFNKNELETWIPNILSTKPAVLIVHLRTAKEMSKVPAHLEYMNRIVKMRNEVSPETVIIGNGDVINLVDAKKKVEETGCDGVMLGRAIFGNPWLFSTSPNPLLDLGEGRHVVPVRSVNERLTTLIEHAKLFEEIFKNVKSFAIMKKHFKAYVKDFPGAVELRAKLMEAENAAQVEVSIVDTLRQLC